MDNFNNPDQLKNKQYKDSSNLGTRINLQRLYTKAEEEWPLWVFDRLKLKAGEHVLECGCGPGNLWLENIDRIPPNCHFTLTDLSEGMVAEAKANLSRKGPHFEFQPLNIEQLPYDDNSFDLVIANHMLYHVPDIPKAVGEVMRVLKPNGRFVAATNGNNHMKELAEIGQTLFKGMEELKETRLMRTQDYITFRLENGINFLEEQFSQVDLHLYESSLLVTESAPLIQYILSMNSIYQDPPQGVIEKLTAHLDEQIAQKGHVYITKESGLFVSRP